MRIRLQSSCQIKKYENGITEIFSSDQKKKYQINLKNRALHLFIAVLQEGINYPGGIVQEAQRIGVSETSLYSLIGALKKNGLLYEDNDDFSCTLLQNSPYDRQIRFFRTFERTGFSGDNLNQNLQNKTVLITGLGGYGSWLALLCARMGIRKIIGIDFDRVEVTNLHRQVIYDQQDIGKLKIDVCKKKIQSADPTVHFVGNNIKITHPEDLIGVLEEVDLIINPFSYLPSKKAPHHPAGIVAQASLYARKPCLTLGGSWIGPLTLGGETPCYFCAIKKLEEKADLDPEHRNPNIQKRAFAPPIATCCSMAAFEAARFLSKCNEPQVLRGVIQLDIFDFSNSQFFDLRRDPDCSFCSQYADKTKRSP